jgi:VanZ family protein
MMLPVMRRNPGIGLFYGWLAYIAFVVYGSLVPLDFHSLPLAQAWAKFQQIPLLQLGVQSRADWVANGVLYVPVGFLTAALFASRGGVLLRLPKLIGVALFCFALAAAVEFVQVFFPPRTVSRNDVIAEWIGSGLGIVIAIYWADWCHRFLATLAGKKEHFVAYGLQAYAVAYLAFSFFPYDFLLAATELVEKLDSDSWGWLLAPQSRERGVIVLATKLLAETLAVIPIGMMLARWNATHRTPASQKAWLLGGLLGLSIEVIQFFIYSGISQGLSLLTRAAGVFAGAVIWRERERLHDLRQWGADGRILLPLVVLYLLALAVVTGWFASSWQGFAAAEQSLAATRFLPFYYHYFTTEQAALLSFVSVMLMYAPIGVLAWLRWWSPTVASWLAMLAAAGIEASKLFLPGMHADPTNVLIAAFAAWVVVRLLDQLSQGNTPQSVAQVELPAKASAATDRLQARSFWAGAAVLGLAAWLAIDFPVWSVALALALLGYAVLLWFRPYLLWVAIPAALPLLDLAPWSGRFFLDEFDYLVMVSLAIGYARTAAVPRCHVRDGGSLAIAALLALVFAIGTLRGLLPWQWPDLNSFTNYYSPYNAVRIAKGALWALLLFALMPRFTVAGRDIRSLFAVGMVIGLVGTIVVVVWERLVFPGLFNFTDIYRVTGPFSTMHVGGPDLETFLTAAVPFAVLMMVSAKSLVLRISAGVALLAATYALMVTFARAGYAGFAVAVSIALLFVAKKRLQGAPWRLVVPAAMIAAVLVIAMPIYSGSFSQQRVSQSGKDLVTRMDHWRDTLAMRDGGLMADLFGMGLGRFPETHYWRSTEPRSGGYRLGQDGDNTFLRLGAGDALYVEQFVATEPWREYTLQLSIRSSQPDAAVMVALCEKWLLTSGRCEFQSATTPGQSWQQYELKLASGDVGSGTGPLRPPVKLSFYNAASASVDIDNIRMMDMEGRTLIANGDFARSLDRWFFSADQDLPWHVWSLPVAVLFELGWFGLVALGAALLFALRRLTQIAWQGGAVAAASLAALAGILVIAGVGTVIDAPRFLLLLMLMLLINRQHR